MQGKTPKTRLDPINEYSSTMVSVKLYEKCRVTKKEIIMERLASRMSMNLEMWVVLIKLWAES
jgi:hypothetical protein